ncbi:MAG: O-antigen ligase family protein [Candidatus Aureabacteria bacterium]|nr:O-antigen ligase family protein [Candidatus Auribacterota bacterium]
MHVLESFIFLFCLILFIISFLESGLQDLTYYFLYTTLSFLSFFIVLFKKPGEKKVTLELLFFLAVYLLIMLSSLFSVDPNVTRIASNQVFSAVLLFFTFSNLSFEKRQQLVKSLIAASTFLAVLGIIQTLTGSGGFRSGGGIARAHSVFVTPNTFAGFCAVFLILSLYFFFSERKKERVLLYGLSAFILTGGIVCSFSRSVVLLFVPMTVFVFTKLLCSFQRSELVKAYFKKRITSVFLLIAGCGVIFILAAFLGDSEYVKERLMSYLRPHRASSLHARMLYWRSAWGMIKDFFPCGSGYSTFATIYPWYKDPSFQGVTHFFAHNDAIQFLSELGPLGLFALLFFWAWAFVKTYRSNGFSSACGFALLFLIFFSVFEYVFYLPTFLFIMVLFFAVMTLVEKQREHLMMERIVRIVLIGAVLTNVIFLARLFSAEKEVKRARKRLEKPQPSEHAWGSALEDMREAEKMMPKSVSYKLNSFRIMAVLYENFQRKDLAEALEKKFDDISALAPYHKKAVDAAYVFFARHQKDRQSFYRYYLKVQKLIQERSRAGRSLSSEENE